MKLTTLTFNVADSPVNVGKGYRFGLIADEVKQLNPDVVFFQELVSKKSLDVLREGLGDYHFCGEDNPKKFGGLAVFVKNARVLSTHFTRYSHQAYWFPLSWADKILGKGYATVDVAFARKTLRFITSHTVCNYFNTADGRVPLRSQLLELAGAVSSYKKPLVVSGDLNLVSDSVLYHEFIKQSHLYDPLRRKHALTFNPDAVAKPWNVFSRLIYGEKKFDYTLTKNISPEHVSQRVVLNKRVSHNGKLVWLSDHFGLLTTLEV